MATNHRDVYQEVTDKLIKALEQGIIPWKRPWKSAGGNVHINMKTKRPYRGVNIFLLDVTAALNGYEHPFWLTFKQAQEMGGKVRKGEKSTLVTFWKILKVETEERDSKGRPKTKNIPLLKYFNVFNVAQIDGIKMPEVKKLTVAIKPCEAIVKAMPNRPTIGHGGDRACYQPAFDRVQMPTREQFGVTEHYYSTLFHELVHSTGHESRTGRVKDWTKFGSNPYAQEELVAEMGSAMLCGVTGIEPKTVDNSVAYIQNWLSVLKGDKKFVVSAASKAQQAADYITAQEETSK